VEIPVTAAPFAIEQQRLGDEQVGM
jgi:hypothetical protein